MIRKELRTWERADGFIYDWLVCGFFDSGLQANPNPSLFDKKFSDNWETDLLAPWGGEAAIRDVPIQTGRASVEWQPVRLVYNPELLLSDLRDRYDVIEKAMGDMNADGWQKLYYALAIIEADHDIDVTLRFSGWDGCRLWVNGTLAFDEHSYHHIIFEMESVPVKLKKGLNTLLFKLDRDGVIARIDSGRKTCAARGIRAIATAEPPEPRRIATVQQLKRWALEKETTMPFKGRSPQRLASWQKKARTFFQRCLGAFPAIPEGETELVSTETTDDGIERRLYHMPSEGASILPFYVLIPSKAKRNDKYITIAHGHGKRWKDIAGINTPPEDRPSQVGPYTGDYGIQLSRKGFVTSVCCERAFADRNDYRGSQDLCTHAFMMAAAQGYCYPLLHMHDIRRMTQFVMNLPEVKGMAGPGLTGLSGGGTMTYLLGAYDDTYQACAVWCGMCRYRDYAMDGGCGMQVVPGLWPTLDVGELLALIAPRPLLLGQGTRDATFNRLTVQSIYEDALPAYKAAGAADKIAPCYYDLAHQVNIEAAAEFFEKNL